MDMIKRLLKDMGKLIEDEGCIKVKTWHIMFSQPLYMVNLGLIYN